MWRWQRQWCLLLLLWLRLLLLLLLRLLLRLRLVQRGRRGCGRGPDRGHPSSRILRSTTAVIGLDDLVGYQVLRIRLQNHNILVALQNSQRLYGIYLFAPIDNVFGEMQATRRGSAHHRVVSRRCMGHLHCTVLQEGFA